MCVGGGGEGVVRIFAHLCHGTLSFVAAHEGGVTEGTLSSATRSLFRTEK